MDLNTSWIAGIAGLLCGIISGFGIGGGSLLMVWMTAAASMDQKIAQGINLLYFLPTAIAALIFHIKNKMICWKAVLPAAVFGCGTACLTAWLSSTMDVGILRKLFGAFLLIVGISELLKSRKKKQ